VGGWRERSRTLTVFAPLSPQVHDPDLASVKDKNEAELKKEVKKLQKFRDQVKTW
jgi:CCR4-NOT transcriptional regulation complex NOT5 subunit